ncbi:MAG: phosphotransferase [Chloroflexota bacterium]
MNWDALFGRGSEQKQLARHGMATLAAYGLDNAKLHFVSDSENVIFRVDATSGPYVLRIHPPESKAKSTILGELVWLDALRRETAIQVPKPVATSDGGLIHEIKLDNDPGPRSVVLFHWLPGELLGDHLNTGRVQQMGTIMARLHNHGEQFVLPHGANRAAWEGNSLSALQADLEKSQDLSKSDLALCTSAIMRLENVMAGIETTQNHGMIHNDLHSWNCLLHEDEISIIDFDDCQIGSFVEDIAITLNSFDEFPESESLCAALLKGYEQVRALPANFEAEVEAFITLRALGLIRWVLSWPTINHQPFGPDMLENSLRRVKQYIE